MKQRFIPTSEPVLAGNERRYVLDCLRRNWIGFDGLYSRKFEQLMSRYLGVDYAVACSSGTGAIHLALAALGVGPGDEVLVPDLTIIVSASMPILLGARPVLVDVDDFGCMAADKIEAKITYRTKAILVVHLYGQPANIVAIRHVARKHKLAVLEDACMALGAEVEGKKVGTIGDVGCFSFYSSKTVTTGEGGMVVTSTARVAATVRQLRNQGFESPRFIHRQLGFNYRLTDLQAAVGVAQMENVVEKVARRREIARRYTELLAKVSGLTLPQDPPWGKGAFWMYTVLVGEVFGQSRETVLRRLKRRGVGSERFFLPLHQQPVFVQGKDARYPKVSGVYPQATRLGEQGLYLPSGLGITRQEQERVVQALVEFGR